MSMRLVAAIAISTSACTTYSSTTVRRWSVDQTAMVLAPTAPHMLGPLVRDRHVALEGAISVAQVQPSGRGRGEGEIGNIVFDGEGRGRIAYGWRNRIEASAEFGYAAGGWSTPIARDVSVDPVRRPGAWEAGLGVRGTPIASEHFAWGLGFELTLAGLPWSREIRTNTMRTDTSSSYSWWGWSSSTSSSSSGSMGGDAGAAITAQARASTFLLVTPVRGAAFQGGVAAQLVPMIPGHLEYEQTCSTSYDSLWGRSSSCTGSVLPARPDWSLSPVITLFASMSFDLGPFTLIASAYTHALAATAVTRAVPGGADLALRLSF